MSEIYGGFYLVRDSSRHINERCFAPEEKNMFDSKKTNERIPCGKKIIYKEWFESPIENGQDLNMYINKALAEILNHNN